MKKYRLKDPVRRILVVLVLLLIGRLMFLGFSQLKAKAKQCDLEKGYVCSIYELRNY